MGQEKFLKELGTAEEMNSKGVEAVEQKDKDNPGAERESGNSEAEQEALAARVDTLEKQVEALEEAVASGLDIEDHLKTIEQRLGEFENKIAEVEERVKQTEEARAVAEGEPSGEKPAKEPPQVKEDEWPIGVSRKGIRFW
jgi:hypothetical protein